MYYYISYTETFNNRGGVITSMHPIEWLARKNYSGRLPSGTQRISTVITYVLEITPEALRGVVRNLVKDGIILSSELEVENAD